MNNNTAFAVIAIVSALALFGVVAAVTVASITLQQKQKQEGAERVRRSTLHRDDASEDRIENKRRKQKQPINQSLPLFSRLQQQYQAIPNN
jgi:Na+-translocating ferredoxin:NAD+ oxidoreductase RnfG subunit